MSDHNNIVPTNDTNNEQNKNTNDDPIVVDDDVAVATATATTATTTRKRSRKSKEGIEGAEADNATTTSDTTKKRKKKKSSSSSSKNTEAAATTTTSTSVASSSENIVLQNEVKSQVDEYMRYTKAQDYSQLILKPDHAVRPIWVTPDKHIFLETFSPIYQQAYDFLVAIAEPLSRPENLHEYMLTEYSLYAAVSIGLGTEQILKILEKLSKIHLSTETKDFITNCTKSYGKVKLVIQQNKFHVESPNREVVLQLLTQSEIANAAVRPEKNGIPKATIDPSGKFYVVKRDSKDNEVERFQVQSATNKNVAALDGSSSGVNGSGNDQLTELTKAVQELNEDGDEDDDELGRSHIKELYSFQIDASKVENVKKCCMKNDFPMLEEYDFKNDTVNENLGIDLKPTTTIRSYQEKSLSKMFSNGRARSGIIVLPCGAGKTLVGITAACTVKKSTLVLCINQVSVEQWRNQFRLWTTVADDRIVTFTSTNKTPMPKDGPVVVITTYNMITMPRNRNADGRLVMEQMQNREWGLMVLDEVHVAPADMFRKVISVVKAHCKLGLTATLLREDDRIDDLYFLVGSKLYEANWLDLQRNGFLAVVQCVEVWCPMTPEFYAKYLEHDTNNAKKKFLYIMNPNKVRACEYLIRVHEKRGDKTIVFSDNVCALEYYARELMRPYIFGDTSQNERIEILERFRQSTTPEHNTVFISKVGDTAIDIPEATVIIQISSHFGSRRQEAQRLGRILRPKGLGARNQQAFFYSLVSQDTMEMFYSSKRQKFLVDQGYSFRVWENIHESFNKHPQELTLMKSKQEEIALLQNIFAMDDSRAATEKVDKEGRTRKNASAKDKSGASGSIYDEKKSKDDKPSHPLFRNRDRGRISKLNL